VSPRFLTVEAIQKIQADSIETYGGSHGLREPGLLKSALDRAENRFFFEPDSSMASLAASLGWGLIKNHVFIDGNKRAGLAAMITFLELNGFELACSVDEARDRTLQAAASEITEAEWTRWVEGAARPR
jgi:death-on-curing protein